MVNVHVTIMVVRFVVMETVLMRKCGDEYDEDTVDRIKKGDDLVRRPPRADQVDLHAICSECLRVQQGFDCRLWFLMKKIPTLHKINKIKIKLLHKLLPLCINYKTHSCDSFQFKS